MINLGNEKNKEIVLEEAVFVGVVAELQRHLASPDTDYPGDLVDKIIEQREQATPKLLVIVEEFLACSPRNINSEKWRDGIFAFLLLGKLREPKAFPHVVRLCSMPHKLAEDCFGDVITEHATWLLASTFNGDFKKLYNLVVNQYLWEISRWAVLDAYVVLYGQNTISRKEILDSYSDFFDKLYDDSSGIPSALVSCCLHIQAIELSEQIERYFTGGRIDPIVLDREDVKESFSKVPGQELKDLKARSKCYDFVDDIERSSGWLFEKEEESSCQIDKDEEFKRAACALYSKRPELFEDRSSPIHVSTQVVRSDPKIGRNDPCSCGSGKKYKKCCSIN